MVIEFGLDWGDPDFVEYAKSYGVHGYRFQVTDPLPVLRDKCLNGQGVYLIEISVGYSVNKKVLIDELNSIICIQ